MGTGGSHPGAEPRVGWFLGRGERALLRTQQRQAFQSVQEARLPGFSGLVQRLLVKPLKVGRNLTLSHLGKGGMGRRDPPGLGQGPHWVKGHPLQQFRVCMCVRGSEIH